MSGEILFVDSRLVTLRVIVEFTLPCIVVLIRMSVADCFGD